MQPIRLATERLILREFASTDAPAMYRYRSDPEVKRYDTFGPNTAQEIEALLARIVSWQTEQPRTRYLLAITLATTGEVVGEAMLALASSSSGPSGELGYLLNQAVWGHGYATEVVQALIEFGRTTLGLHEVVAECDAANNASWHVLEKAGLHLVADEVVQPTGRITRHYARTLTDG